MDDQIATARTFYKALAADNTKSWWQANRAPYDTQLKPAALALLDRLAPLITARIAPESCEESRPRVPNLPDNDPQTTLYA